VLSDSGDHTAWAGIGALEVVLASLPQHVLDTADALDMFTDNGGHFTSKAYLGGILHRIAQNLTLQRASVNHHPCYHGKDEYVDGGACHTRTMLESAITNDSDLTKPHSPPPLLDNAKKIVAALNTEWPKSQKRQAAYGKPVDPGREYLALYADLSRHLPGVDGRHHLLEMEGIRSTYCVRSAKEPGRGWSFYNAGTAKAGFELKGLFLGTAEDLITKVHRPEPKSGKKGKPWRRNVDLVDLQEKRNKRDAWGGVPKRGQFENADAKLLESARKPTTRAAKQDPEAWIRKQVKNAIADPKLCRIFINIVSKQCPVNLQLGHIIGEGGMVDAEDKPVKSVEIEALTLHDRFKVEYSVDHLVTLWKAAELHFLPQASSSTMRGTTPVWLCPWGLVGHDPPRGNGDSERVWMALCEGCGQWREVDAATRTKFAGKLSQFRCMHSSHLKRLHAVANCKSPLTDLEGQFKRVGYRPADRR